MKPKPTEEARKVVDDLKARYLAELKKSNKERKELKEYDSLHSLFLPYDH